ncbi:ABC transporter ATP-binding protein [Paenibacillus alkaliterrae]|uniref:ABC transporter ATP-binding protein n=1 Tax=Paenibacillus alkaliterrae TaxID=320909 RepID=UPI001F34C2C3|nr:ABC transporter ATP-binding protein [Paenibacillus alkaliterrae]MCF2940330.1 ABC transporter ATP-binding protein [Paenibacillus alkaliterrae]
MNVDVSKLSYKIDQQSILHSIFLQVRKGELVGLVGPNGSGKSTLLKNMYRVLQPDEGMISIDGYLLSEMTYKESARKVSVVSQETAAAFDFKVREIVLMGRHPHQSMFRADTAGDLSIVQQALAKVGMAKAAERSFHTLSGGEKQRVLIARALAQQASFLILDEPTNHLDIRYQLQIMDLVKNLKLTAIAALHDLNIAACYCDRIYMLKEGYVVASGKPEDVLTTERLLEVFGVQAVVSPHPITGRLSIAYISELFHDAVSVDKRAEKREETSDANAMHLLSIQL